MEAALHQFDINLNGSKIDTTNRTIRQVSLISLGEAKGHNVFVDGKTLEQVFDCLTKMGTVKVKADHGSGVFSTFGYADGFEKTDTQVLGDLHAYETEPEAPRIFEIARKNPSHLGMSLEFGGDDEKIKNKKFARCNMIQAVALVSDPAANKSLFEKNVDKSAQNVNSKDMPITKLDDKPEEKKDEKKPEPQSEETELSKMCKKYEEMLSRYQKHFDEGAVNDADDKKSTLPATNPNTEPVANNNGPTIKNKEGGANKGDEPSANPPGGWEETEKRFAALAEKSAEMAAEKATRKFGAALGIRSLPAQNAPMTPSNTGKKEFAVLLAEKQTELEAAGDKKATTNAMLYCIKNYKAEYAASRLVNTPARIL